MKYIYKKIKIAVPHCPKCNKRLKGNGSIYLPYQCDCGVWKIDISTGEYEIIKRLNVN